MDAAMVQEDKGAEAAAVPLSDRVTGTCTHTYTCAHSHAATRGHRQLNKRDHAHVHTTRSDYHHVARERPPADGAP